MEAGDGDYSQSSEDHLFEDYNVKVQYLTGYLSRMWTRFNFLLVLNSGLFAFSVQKDIETSDWLFILAGIVLSILWYVFGANDNYIVEVYRKQVECSYELLGLKKELQADRGIPNKLTYFSYAGDLQDKELLPQGMRLQLLFQGDRDSDQCMNFLQWRWKGDRYTTSPHYMAAVIPIAFLVLWFIRLLSYVDETTG